MLHAFTRDFFSIIYINGYISQDKHEPRVNKLNLMMSLDTGQTQTSKLVLVPWFELEKFLGKPTL